MAIVSISRWRASIDQAMPIAREIAPVLKRHGALWMRVGPCFSGPDAGKVYVAIGFADWAGFGRTMQAASADPDYQRLYAEALKMGELLDRSVVVSEEL